MKALVDTNVLLDVLYDRKPFWDFSSPIWNASETGSLDGIVSALSVANVIYIMRKELNADGVQETVSRISISFFVSNLLHEDLIGAAGMRWKDFEDALQVMCAVRNCADFIITRNIRDFADSPVPAVTPEEFLQRLSRLEGES